MVRKKEKETKEGRIEIAAQRLEKKNDSGLREPVHELLN